jgi:hypothetical protein
MGKPCSAKEIRERREKILLLLSKGYNQTDIAKELNTTRQTVMRDMKNINEMTNKGLYDLAKATLSTMYFNCIIGLNEVQKECWKIYHNLGNDPTINNWHKIAALKLATEINDKKFGMFQNGPAIIEVNRLGNELNRIKNAFRDNNNDSSRYKRGLSYNREDLHDLGLPHHRESEDFSSSSSSFEDNQHGE